MGSPNHVVTAHSQKLRETPRWRRKVLLVIRMKTAFPDQTHILWHEVASFGKRRPVSDDGRNQDAGHSMASVSVYLQEREALFERTWFLLPDYRLRNYILVASSTPAVSIECTNK